MKPELPPALIAPPPHGPAVWWAAIRPRTLSIAVAPVAVGTALALAAGSSLAWLPMLAALLCALLIQVGTNLHNDAADFERGGDGPERIGPLRVTAAGWASAASVRRAALMSFSGALLLGVYLVQVGGWPILAIGVASLAAGWAYSGGPRPISHTACGEVFVLAFFGIFAVFGSCWLQGVNGGLGALLAGTVVGLPAAAVLLVNNYRDLDSDLRTGRRTLAAILGPARVQPAYAAFMLLPLALLLPLEFAGYRGAAAGLLVLPLFLREIRRLKRTPRGPELNLRLADTARAGFLLNAALALGLGLGALR